MNVNTTVVRNVYERRVTNFTPVNRISYNGGNGGSISGLIGSEAMAMRARRMGPAPAQVQYQREAAANREQFAAVNHGRPSVAAARPAAAPAVAAPGERRAAEGEAIVGRPQPSTRGQSSEARLKRGGWCKDLTKRLPITGPNRRGQDSNPAGPRLPPDHRSLSKDRRLSGVPPVGPK